MWLTSCSQGKVENVHECPWQTMKRRHDQDEPSTDEDLGHVFLALCARCGPRDLSAGSHCSSVAQLPVTPDAELSCWDFSPSSM